MTLLRAVDSSTIASRLRAQLGPASSWKSKSGANCSLWTHLQFEIIATHEYASDVQLRRTLEDRKHLRAQPVVLIADSDDADKVRIVGPHEPFVVRKLNTTSVLDLIEHAGSLNRRQAASFLERELRRLDESVLPGIRVRELLTPHYIKTRIRQYPRNRERLDEATANIKRIGRSTTWRTLFGQLGYQIERSGSRGYLLKHRDAPVVVVHPLRSADEFVRMNENGQLPDGVLLSDCRSRGASWGILVSDLRFRIFQAEPDFGSATARYIEIDVRELESQDRRYLGLLAPDALKPNGWLTEWASDARDFGEELRKGLEERIRTEALPNFAKGIGRYLETNQHVDLQDREKLREIEEAVLTLVFRFMFLLHVEARGYLPMNSDAYNAKSARKLADESKMDQWEYDSRSTRLWDSLRTLTRMIRNGDRSVGVPAYNGSLFAADRFPGADLLEQIEITDNFVAPAIRAIAFDPEQSDAGLDYAGLQIGHLGAIYEALLSLKLTRSSEDLKYDARRDVYRPMRAGETADITGSDLFYQTEKGGRKSGGVYYTREEFVRHLLKHSLEPALDAHLEYIKKLAAENANAAAEKLFDFSVVDPAMGSGHFLTTALDIMADSIEVFLAENGLPAIRKQLDDLRRGENDDLASVEDVDLLRRLILKRCIYGVDISPMAVEVANVTLWLASFVPGLALSYLGSNLKCGDALIGVAGQSVVDKKQVPLFAERADKAMTDAVKLHGQLTKIADVTPDEVHRSQALDDKLHKSTAGLRRAYDLWTADPLGLPDARELLELHAEEIVAGTYTSDEQTASKVDEATRIAGDYNFLHWALEFPHVFHQENPENPGFDVVVGNPPWEEMYISQLAFYAMHHPGIRGIIQHSDQQRRIAELDALDSSLSINFKRKSEQLISKRKFFEPRNGYTLQGRGHKDLYKFFCERYSFLTRDRGYLAVVLPNAAFINNGSAKFRTWLFEANTVIRLDTIKNAKGWAFPIHNQLTIALLVVACLPPRTTEFELKTSGPSSNLHDFKHNVFQLGNRVPSSIISPKYEIPSVPSAKYSQLLLKLFAGTAFHKAEQMFHFDSSYRLVLVQEMNETTQRNLFTANEGMSVWKGRSFHAYDPHGRDPAGYGDPVEILDWLHAKRLRSQFLKRLYSEAELEDNFTHPIYSPRIAFHDVTNAFDYKTVNACLIPSMTPVTHSAPYIACVGWDAIQKSYLLGVMNSLIFDWYARRYVKLHLSFYILNMLCLPANLNRYWIRIGKLAARLSCVDARYTEFADEAGVRCGTQTDKDRYDMRAEIDALVAKAYDLTEDELRFVFTDYPEGAFTPAYRQLVLEKFERL